jgi:alpha-glucuronidase
MSTNETKSCFSCIVRRLVSVTCLILVGSVFMAMAVDGSALWLPVQADQPVTVRLSDKKPSPTLLLAKQVLEAGWQGQAGITLKLERKADKALKPGGFRFTGEGISATTDAGLLYGAYAYLRTQQVEGAVKPTVSNPSYQLRVLNHWDNLDGSIERGYAGRSIFWRGKHDLTVTEADVLRWKNYGAANASLGINGAVLNNVNTTPDMLSEPVLKRVAAIADVLRPYGITTYLSVNFATPARLGGLPTADPLDKGVITWWKDKVKEIYALIPDFGGFLVKANSEGQAGPQDYGRTHVDGANMLADALKPFGGVVMWRAFVYSPTEKDRAKQAYLEFMPFDGQFRDNVIVQIKNGPVDFQPREPFSPLFGAMKKSATMAELQITQEYLGHNHQLAFLAPMWEECLKSDTYSMGEGSTVARCTDGSLFAHRYTAMAGVANIGLDKDWCGHPFAAANWYAYGRMAWDNNLSSERLAQEWLVQTFRLQDAAQPGVNRTDWNKGFYEPVSRMMLESREAVVDYMMPLGLHHLFAGDHHYGPGPWYAPRGLRADWTPPYYHQADSNGIGFNRSETGTNAVEQYSEPLRSLYNGVSTCPEPLLLWFHHLPWSHQMASGRSLWDELCFIYTRGVLKTRGFQQVWDGVQPYVDAERFSVVQRKLRRQTRDAMVWKDGCLLYFQSINKRPFPAGMERPLFDLELLKRVDMEDFLAK